MRRWDSGLYIRIAGAGAVLATAAVVLLTFERPPVDTVQTGFRGTGMALVYNPRTLAANAAQHAVPEAPEAADPEGPRASEVFENVQVLGNVSAAQFGRIMQAMTEWVSPEQGCNYCHNPENMADDSIYTKVVARRMLQMTKNINQQWATHVGQVGVTCWTCHRGNPVPNQVWATVPDPHPDRVGGYSQNPAGQNIASATVNYSSLPNDPFTPYLLGDHNIRIQGREALPHGNRASIKETEWNYALMFHFSQSLGVSCGHCHNTRSLYSWEQSPPARLTAWHGIGMVRDTNINYINPLAPLWQANPNGPAEGPLGRRIGELGDPLKVNCATCHQGAHKPLYGAPMLQDYPELNAVTLEERRAEAAPRQ